MGRKLWAIPPLGAAGSPSNTMSPWPRTIYTPSGILVHQVVWPQQTWAENWGLTQSGHSRSLPAYQVLPWSGKPPSGGPKLHAHTQQSFRYMTHKYATYMYICRKYVIYVVYAMYINICELCMTTMDNIHAQRISNKKASIRWQDSALPISGYWPTSEPNTG